MEPILHANAQNFVSAIMKVQLRYGFCHTIVLEKDSKFNGVAVKHLTFYISIATSSLATTTTWWWLSVSTNTLQKGSKSWPPSAAWSMLHTKLSYFSCVCGIHALFQATTYFAASLQLVMNSGFQLITQQINTGNSPLPQIAWNLIHGILLHASPPFVKLPTFKYRSNGCIIASWLIPATGSPHLLSWRHCLCLLCSSIQCHERTHHQTSVCVHWPMEGHCSSQRCILQTCSLFHSITERKKGYFQFISVPHQAHTIWTGWWPQHSVRSVAQANCSTPLQGGRYHGVHVIVTIQGHSPFPHNWPRFCVPLDKPLGTEWQNCSISLVFGGGVAENFSDDFILTLPVTYTGPPPAAPIYPHLLFLQWTHWLDCILYPSKVRYMPHHHVCPNTTIKQPAY